MIHAKIEEHVYSIHEKNSFKCQFCDKKFKLMKVHVVWCMRIKKSFKYDSCKNRRTCLFYS